MTGVEMIAAERARQIEVEHWDAEHDDHHVNRELVWAAVCYAAYPSDLFWKTRDRGTGKACLLDPWPWEANWDRRDRHPRIKRLAIAGALIAAEIDRLERKGEA